MDGRFRVGVTRDLRAEDGSFRLSAASLDALERKPGVEWDYLADDVDVLTPGLLDGFDALFHFGPSITAASLEGAERLILVARHGVGLDTIDVDACTDAGVLVSVTPDGVRGPMASAAVALMLALGHRLVERNVVFHEGRWDEGRFGLIGTGMAGRTLGVIGFGNIGREICRLVEPYGMRRIVSAPRLDPAEATRAGVERVELDQLLAESDYVVVACPLTAETHRLLDARRLGLMKPTAFLVNVGRGAVVDEAALVDALRERRIAGAGLDVFEQEPIDPSNPLLELENVVCAPHSLGYTDELFRGCVASACAAILTIACGIVPRFVANPAVVDEPAFTAKLERLRASRVG